MTTTAPTGRRSRQSRVAIAVVVFFGLLLGLFGGVLVGLSQKDYSGYTQHATATVSDVVRDTRGGTHNHRTTTYRVYLDFEADGRSFTHERLQGTVTGTPRVGNTVELLFPPGEPSKAVTEKTTSKTTARVELWVGIGLLVVAVGLLVGVVARVVRARRAVARGEASGRLDG